MKIPVSRHYRAVCLGAAALITTHSVLSQSAKPGTDELVQLERFSITASRGHLEDPMRVPQSLDVVAITNTGSQSVTDVDDVVRRLPNVGLAPAEGTSNFWQEGFSLRGLGAQRVLVLTDGVRQSGQGVGYGGGNLSLYDLFGLDRVEVLRGPASVLYGTDALGGVINIITREPAFTPTLEVGGAFRYEYDAARNFERFNALAHVGTATTAVVTTLSSTDADFPELADGTRTDSGAFRKQAAMVNADFALGAHLKLRVFGNLCRDTDVAVSKATISILRPSPLDFSFPLYQRSQMGMELRAEKLRGPIEETKLGLHWQQVARKFDRTSPLLVSQKIGPTAVGPRQESVRVVTDDTVDTYELQGLLRGRRAAHAWLAGLDLGFDNAYLPETETHTLVFNPLTGAPVTPAFSGATMPRLRADAAQWRLGIFAQDRWILSPAWEATVGMRADAFRVDEATGRAPRQEEKGVSGNLALLRVVSDHFSLYGQLATGFRAPDLGERFQTAVVSVVTTTTVLGKPDLVPERSLNGEFGAKFRTQRFQGNVAVFANRVRDYIESVSLDAATKQYTNLDSVFLYGAEAGVTARPAAGWEIFANAGRTYAPSDDDRLHVASWTFNYGTVYTARVGCWTLRPELNIRSALHSTERTGDTLLDYGGFTAVDAQVGVQGFLPSRLGSARLTVGVRNVLDRVYREPFFDSVQIGRGLFTSMVWEF